MLCMRFINGNLVARSAKLKIKKDTEAQRFLIFQTQMTQMTLIFFLSSNKVKNQLNPRRKNQSHSVALKSVSSAASASENTPSEGKPCSGATPVNYHLLSPISPPKRTFDHFYTSTVPAPYLSRTRSVPSPIL